MSTVLEVQQNTPVKANIFNYLAESDHEQVMFCNDEATGLKSIIAIHNTTLGPALGGTRLWVYGSDSEALYDVLRLSRGMTYKSAISGINLGGGKAVILGDPKVKRGESFWRRYGKFVNNLNGKYITAEDVGTSTREMEFIAMETQHVAGKPVFLGGSGDPSPVTAYGTYLGMKASMKKLTGNDSLNGKKVSVQGVGHVGQYLVDHLMKEGATVYVSDINEHNLKAVTDKHNAEVVGIDAIYDLDVDIYAPCALGATVNDDTLSRMKASIIAGAANNQLADEDIHGQAVKERGILYAPDFLINAGGVINCYTEATGDYNKPKAMGNTERIYERTIEIFEYASNNNITTHQAAVKMAEERIASIANLKAKI